MHPALPKRAQTACSSRPFQRRDPLSSVRAPVPRPQRLTPQSQCSAPAWRGPSLGFCRIAVSSAPSARCGSKKLARSGPSVCKASNGAAPTGDWRHATTCSADGAPGADDKSNSMVRSSSGNGTGASAFACPTRSASARRSRPDLRCLHTAMPPSKPTSNASPVGVAAGAPIGAAAAACTTSGRTPMVSL